MAFLTGCVAKVPVGQGLSPQTFPLSETFPFPIALYFENNSERHVEEVRLSTIHRARKTYQFSIGAGMAWVIEAQMRVIFSRVEVHPAQATLQSLRGSDLFGVMRIGLKRSDIDIHYSASPRNGP